MIESFPKNAVTTGKTDLVLAAMYAAVGVAGASLYLEQKQTEDGKLAGSLKVFGPAVLLPALAAVTTYMVSGSIPLAIAAGAGTAFTETVTVGNRVISPYIQDISERTLGLPQTT